MIKVIDKKIDKHILKEICDAHFKTMVKFVVDIKLKIYLLDVEWVHIILTMKRISPLVQFVIVIIVFIFHFDPFFRFFGLNQLKIFKIQYYT